MRKYAGDDAYVGPRDRYVSRWKPEMEVWRKRKWWKKQWRNRKKRDQLEGGARVGARGDKTPKTCCNVPAG